MGIREGYDYDTIGKMLGWSAILPIYMGGCALNSGWWTLGAWLLLFFLPLRIYFSIRGEISLFHYGQICCASFLITVHEIEEGWWIGLLIGLCIFALSTEFVFRKIKPLPVLETEIGGWLQKFLDRRESFSRPPSDEEIFAWKELLELGEWTKAGVEIHEGIKHSYYVRPGEELVVSESSGQVVSKLIKKRRKPRL
jgi:hypothetical protein